MITLAYTWSSISNGTNLRSRTEDAAIFDVVRLGFKRALTSCFPMSVSTWTTAVGTSVLVLEDGSNVAMVVCIFDNRGAGTGGVSVLAVDMDPSESRILIIRGGPCSTE